MLPSKCYLSRNKSTRLLFGSTRKKFITFNNLEEYLELLKEYMNVPNEKFKEISIDYKNLQQINNGTIQMESEFYNHIRPKGRQTNEETISQLKQSGIEYLEIRSIDLNPYSEIGLSQHDIEFWELLIILCALSDSAEIKEDEALIIKENLEGPPKVGKIVIF
ncbi:MAG: hypothetical protein CM15mP22_5210 [Gammaproteobacteria bacterium]|nr:MAG: hypothetical protein CM15mP22_5210 [Gammaproteobacteria bacterium]